MIHATVDTAAVKGTSKALLDIVNLRMVLLGAYMLMNINKVSLCPLLLWRNFFGSIFIVREHPIALQHYVVTICVLL